MVLAPSRGRGRSLEAKVLLKKINLRSDLLATVICFAALALIKLCSSVILTRILAPEAYGVIATLSSIVAFVEMFSDLGILGLMIRHEKGDEQRFVNTMWTIRQVRGVINFSILFLGAPLIASLYDTPLLAGVLRTFSFWFILHALESMSFILASRHRKIYIVNYTELFANLATVPFVILYSLYSKDYHGILYGMLLNRFILTAASHLFFKPQRPHFGMDREARRDLFNFSKHIVPSSILAFFLNQFDRIIFLKLFDLHLFGLYGLASNVGEPFIALIQRISRLVLYPRCSHDFRSDRATAHQLYYTNNVRIFLIILALPALAGGAADLIIQILFDPRYAYAGTILRAFMVRGIIISLAAPAEDLLVASGKTHVVLVGNILRACWVVPGCLLGYYLFGFQGFLVAAMLETLPALIYLWYLQYRDGMMIVKYEWIKLALVVGIFSMSFVVSQSINLEGVRLYLKSLV
jgi:lipopolysaccharide exporter